MAVVFKQNASRLTIEYDAGTDAQGRKLIVRGNYTVKTDASDQDVLDSAKILSGLQQYPVNQILRQNTGTLIEQA